MNVSEGMTQRRHTTCRPGATGLEEYGNANHVHTHNGAR
jgi:hypothetical protein